MLRRPVSVLLLFAASASAAAAYEAKGARDDWTPPYCQEDFFATELRCAPRPDGSTDEQYRQLNKIDTVAADRRKPYQDLFAWPSSR